MIRGVRYLIEALIVKIGMLFFTILGSKNAANLGSFLARHIGKMHFTHKLAGQNLAKALPNLNQEQREIILNDMWDNLGRVVGEYVHIVKSSPQKLVEKYIIFDKTSRANIEFLKQNKKGGIIFSAHLGNWEIGPKIFMNEGLDVKTVYRPLNNPYVEKMTASIRGSNLIAKGSKGSRQIIDTIQNGGYVMIMADQKISEGEEIKFFHQDALTTTSIARMALKYNIPLIPVRSIRVDYLSKFMAEVEKPLDFQKSGDLNEDVKNLTRLINCKLEEWISQYPAQWFWVHNRWKK